MKKLVFGIGVNDADYHVHPKINGNRQLCKYYKVWKHMLERCYDEKALVKRPTYRECTVCEEWLTFSNFKRWMETQDWEDKHLDKDILKVGNKVYCPEFCVFVTHKTNTFTLGNDARRGEFPIGVHYDFEFKKYKAQCQNPFSRKYENLGWHKSPSDAHLAWKKRKHELACRLAAMQTDKRVSDALMVRYV